ncbi:MAG: DUF92 domain-containing protein [Rhodothermales bacterium]
MDALRHDLLAFALSAAGLLVLVGVGEALRVWGRVSAEGSRRVVHAGVGVFVAVTPYLFEQPGLVYVLAVLFVIVNYVTLRRGGLRGIHSTARRSLGTVTFPLAFLPALAVCWTADPGRLFALQLAFLILAFADPLASVVGMRLRSQRGEEASAKSVAGSTAFFVTSLLLSLGALLWFRAEEKIDWSGGEVVVAAVVVALVTTAVEALGRRGWDNFFIVQAAIVVLVAFDEQPTARLVLVGAVGAGLVFGVAAYRLRFLNGPGAIAGGLLAASLIGLGGWAWAVPAFAFFVLSSLLSQVGRRRKAAVEAVSEKGSLRDAAQVYANGGVGWTLLLLYAVFPAEVFYWGFLGAFAAATADTWGTELGTLSPRLPRLNTTGRAVPRGTSGAVSVLGTVGALGGALVIWLSAWPFAAARYAQVGLFAAAGAVVLGGFLASLVDSLAGATVQARFRDLRTGQETEHSASAGGEHPLVRGWRWLGNDQVNWLCTFSGAVFAMACFLAVIFAS